MLLVGPKRVSERRIVGLPRTLMRAIGLEAPVRVALSVDPLRRETVFVAASSDGENVGVMISSVGQLVIPTEALSWLNLGVERAVYLRAREDLNQIELMSPRQGFAVASDQLAEQMQA